MEIQNCAIMEAKKTKWTINLEKRELQENIYKTTLQT